MWGYVGRETEKGKWKTTQKVCVSLFLLGVFDISVMFLAILLIISGIRNVHGRNPQGLSHDHLHIFGIQLGLCFFFRAWGVDWQELHFNPVKLG